MAATDYVVFRETNTGDWELLGKTTATTGDAAIRERALVHGDGTYAATPARSWTTAAMKVQPRAVAVKP